MKYLQFLTLLFTLFCKEENKNPFAKFPESDKHSLFFLDYANLTDFKETDEFPELGANLVIKENKTCIYSNSTYFLNKEYGPKLGICFENTELNLSNLNLIFNSTEKVFGNLTYQDKNIWFDTKTRTEVVKEISETENPLLFFGEEELETSLKEKTNQVYTNSFSLSGNTGKKIESSFSISYFSLYKTTTELKIIFPLNKNYLVLDLSQVPEIKKEIEKFFNSIEGIHTKIVSACKQSEISFTEVYLGENEFLEWKNNSNQILCITDFSIQLNSEVISISNSSKFYFPYSVKTLIENSTISKNLPNSKKFWSELRTNSKVNFLSNELKAEIFIPRSFTTSTENTTRSFKLKENLCEFNTSHDENLCADPGIDLELEEKFYAGICDINEFELSELNSFGIRDKEKIETDGKFLELEYLGKKSCELKRIKLFIGSKAFSLNSKEKILPSSLIVFGKREFFKQNLNLIQINMNDLNLYQRINLKSRKKNKILFSGIHFLHEYSFLDKNKNVHSVLIKNEKIIFHPKFDSKTINPFYSNEHFFSPGEKNPLPENSTQLILNEIHWAGAYRGTSSLSEEDFVEFLSLGKGTAEVTIQNRKFFFPVEDDEIIVLSEKELVCFPISKNIHFKNFSLKDESTSISIQSNSIPFQFAYDPKRNHGINNTSEKKRFSYVRAIDGIWKNSNEKSSSSESGCSGRVFASPNLSNEFNPFLIEKSNIQLISPDSEKFTNFQIKQINYFPFQELVSYLNRDSLSNNVNFSFLNSNLALVYLELIPGYEIHLFNRDGLYIEGVLPNPTSSENEWVLVCNRGNVSKDLSKYEIWDESSFDEIVSFQTRRGIILPSGITTSDFFGNSTILNPTSCAYILDPDVSFIELNKIGINPNLILTVKTTSTIGNGISSNEKLDLFLNDSGIKTHIHSYGNRFSPKPFSIILGKDEFSLLKKNQKGESESDYEVSK